MAEDVRPRTPWTSTLPPIPDVQASTMTRSVVIGSEDNRIHLNQKSSGASRSCTATTLPPMTRLAARRARSEDPMTPTVEPNQSGAEPTTKKRAIPATRTPSRTLSRAGTGDDGVNTTCTRCQRVSWEYHLRTAPSSVSVVRTASSVTSANNAAHHVQARTLTARPTARAIVPGHDQRRSPTVSSVTMDVNDRTRPRPPTTTAPTATMSPARTIAHFSFFSGTEWYFGRNHTSVPANCPLAWSRDLISQESPMMATGTMRRRRCARG